MRESLREEIEAHDQTKQRLSHQQQLMDTVTKGISLPSLFLLSSFSHLSFLFISFNSFLFFISFNSVSCCLTVAASGVEEFNQLKKAYAAEVALRKDYEQRHGAIIPSAATSRALEESQQKAMADNISNVYLLPTLTELGERLEKSEYELAQMTERAHIAEGNLEKIQGAAVLALGEFNQLKKTYAEEIIRRQEAEKAALELKTRLDAAPAAAASSAGGDSVEQLKRQLETEKQLRKLAENDVSNITKQLNDKQGKQFDLMTVTELECKLESALKSLEFAKDNLQKTEAEKDQIQRELVDLQTRSGVAVGRAPPPPPPPPVFIAVPASDNLKKKIGVLKDKLKGGDEKDDRLSMGDSAADLSFCLG